MKYYTTLSTQNKIEFHDVFKGTTEYILQRPTNKRTETENYLKYIYLLIDNRKTINNKNYNSNI